MEGGKAEEAEGHPLEGTQAACPGQTGSEADPRNSQFRLLPPLLPLLFSIGPAAPSPPGPALAISLFCCHVHAARLAAHTGRREKDLARQGPAPGDLLPFGLEVEGGHFASPQPQQIRVPLTPACAAPGLDGSVARREPGRGRGWRLLRRAWLLPAPPPAIWCPARLARKEWDAGRGGP